jgi:hypothetical protein
MLSSPAHAILGCDHGVEGSAAISNSTLGKPNAISRVVLRLAKISDAQEQRSDIATQACHKTTSGYVEATADKSN